MPHGVERLRSSADRPDTSQGSLHLTICRAQHAAPETWAVRGRLPAASTVPGTALAPDPSDMTLEIPTTPRLEALAEAALPACPEAFAGEMFRLLNEHTITWDTYTMAGELWARWEPLVGGSILVPGADRETSAGRLVERFVKEIFQAAQRHSLEPPAADVPRGPYL